jgi:lipid-A-disaccharide synthase
MADKKLKIFIIAGEVSGDVLGAGVMREMPDAEFIGIGGENMKAVGLRTIFPISDLAVMGIFEVLAHARTLTGRISQTARAIAESRPDIVLTIDSPSFAKRVIKKVRGMRTDGAMPRFYHVVAPQVWAWGARRAKKFAKIFDRLYSFFEFERPYFTRYGLDTIAVGHPIADGLNASKHQPRAGDKKIIALLPGSRMSEVKRLMPVFRSVAIMHAGRGFDFVIPTTETTDAFIRDEIKGWPIRPKLVPFRKRYEILEKTYIAIAASGTISAELAIMRIPAVIVYKMNALTMWFARRLVKIKWVSLVNILLGRTVYPELLGSAATAENIAREVERLSRPDQRKKMLAELKSADKKWRRGADSSASRLIAQDIRKSSAKMNLR